MLSISAIVIRSIFYFIGEAVKPRIFGRLQFGSDGLNL